MRAPRPPAGHRRGGAAGARGDSGLGRARRWPRGSPACPLGCGCCSMVGAMPTAPPDRRRASFRRSARRRPWPPIWPPAGQGCGHCSAIAPWPCWRRRGTASPRLFCRCSPAAASARSPRSTRAPRPGRRRAYLPPMSMSISSPGRPSAALSAKRRRWAGSSGICARAAAAVADADEPTGILTHHLVQDDATDDFLLRLMALTAAHPAARWLDGGEVFAPGLAAASAAADLGNRGSGMTRHAYPELGHGRRLSARRRRPGAERGDSGDRAGRRRCRRHLGRPRGVVLAIRHPHRAAPRHSARGRPMPG